MASTRVSKRKLAAAIPGSGGIITQIASRTGYEWHTVKAHIEADDELRQLLEDEEARVDDMAEATVITSIKDGNTQDAKWWLARRRRERFGDNVDVTSGGERVTFTVRPVKTSAEGAEDGD